MSYKYEPTKHEGIYLYYTDTGKKRYRVRIRHYVGNKQKEESKQGFKKLAEARAYKIDLESKIQNGEFDQRQKAKVTLEEQWEKYSSRKIRSNKWNKGTADTNQGRINIWLDKFGHFPIKEITESDVETYILDLYEDNDYSQETMKGFFKVFLQVVDDAVADRYIPYNPFKRIPYEKPGGWEPKEKVLSLVEFKAFMNEAENHMRPDVYRCLYLLTFGLRRGEAYGITQNALEFLDNGLAQINIQTAKTRYYPQGASVKSKDSKRIIIVDKKAANLLREQIYFAKEVTAKNNAVLHQDDFIFISPNTGKPYDIDRLNDSIDLITKRLDSNMRVTPHMFRHSFATYASASGVDGLQLRKYLGHADIDMTSHYTKSSAESAEKVLKMTENFRK